MITDKQLQTVADVLNIPLSAILLRKALEAYEQSKPKPEPVTPDVYSNDGGEYWVQHPADCDIFSYWDNDPKIGDEYELQVCWTGKQKFRITEIEDGSVDKVELIESDTTYYTAPPPREPLVGDLMVMLRREVRKEFPSASDWLIHLVARLTEQAHGIGTSHEPA